MSQRVVTIGLTRNRSNGNFVRKLNDSQVSNFAPTVRLSLVLVGNSLQRIAVGASGVLVGLYLADLANRGLAIGAGLVGVLGAVSFGAELIAAMPMGIASDAVTPRGLMTGGSLLGAGATQLFGMTGLVGIFFLSRGLEGIGAAAVAPPLLAHLTDVTDHKPALRAKVMSYFELSLLAGLALGGLLAAQLWRWLGHASLRCGCDCLCCFGGAAICRSCGQSEPRW